MTGSAVIVICETMPAMSFSIVRGNTVTSVLFVMNDVGPRVWT